ncbi:MAG TPA: DUF6056 family protein [Anaerolineales bacterium]
MRLLGFTKGGTALQRLALWAGGVFTLAALGLFAYLGTFTRFLADDYCDTIEVVNRPVFRSIALRYMTSSDRFSHLLFVFLIESILPRTIQAVPVLMLALWTVALIWLVWEVKRLAGLQWPFLMDVLLGSLLAFFPAFEAPNRFQTFYWRAGMTSHFAPLVYFTFFTGLLLHLIRQGEDRKPPIWLGVLCFVLAFIGGGFSEPTVAMLVVASLLALGALWRWEKGPRRAVALRLVAWTAGGGLLALAVMGFSPGNAFHMAAPPPPFPLLVERTLLYSVEFIRDSLVTLPLPTIVSILLPAALFYCLLACTPALSSGQRRGVLVLVVVTPILMYGLIAASFAPSVYGQAYPVERARIAGRLMMTTAALVEGACLGTFVAQWQAVRGRASLVNMASLALIVMAVYPLRSAINVLDNNLPYAREWASAWDARQAVIYADKAQGQQDIVIPQLPGFEHVKELDPRPGMWVNHCAAEFYGVRSISAPQMENLP